MTAQEIIDQVRKNPGHPPTISTAEWASVVKAYDELKASNARDLRRSQALMAISQGFEEEIQRLQTTIAQLLDEKKQSQPPLPQGRDADYKAILDYIINWRSGGFHFTCELPHDMAQNIAALLTWLQTAYPTSFSRPFGEWLQDWVASRERRGLPVEY